MNPYDAFEKEALYETRRAIDSQKAAALTQWMHTLSKPNWRWFIKVLSGNDTLATGSHQGGPYVSRRILFELFPSIAAAPSEIGTHPLPTQIDSHGEETTINAKWYPSMPEGRLTGWGGSRSPMLDPEATGSVVLFAFHQLPDTDADCCRAWLCSSVNEEEAVQERVGQIEPGRLLLYDAAGTGLFGGSVPVDTPCTLKEGELPPAWKTEFPPAADIVAAAISRLPSTSGTPPDRRLLRRRDCEYSLFRSIEQALALPIIREGFTTVDSFVEYAKTFTNRRKSRAGTSLGLQLSEIFREEALPHSYNAISEENKRPDFLFPSAQAYHDASNGERLVMLAAKTTCKDRWRQILNEADKIRTKHLLTLQDGISINQHREMEQAGVVLVVPKTLHKRYHKVIRPKLLTLAAFIEQTRATCM